MKCWPRMGKAGGWFLKPYFEVSGTVWNESVTFYFTIARQLHEATISTPFPALFPL